MVLTIPVEGAGYKVGHNNIENEGQSSSFQFERDNDRLFSVVAFRADWGHNLEPVSDGWMMAIVFHLVWKEVAKVADSPLDFPIFLKAFDIVKGKMAHWYSSSRPVKKESPKMSESATPMDIETTPKVESLNLSFSDDKMETDESGNLLLIVIPKTIMINLRCFNWF